MAAIVFQALKSEICSNLVLMCYKNPVVSRMGKKQQLHICFFKNKTILKPYIMRVKLGLTDGSDHSVLCG